MIAKFDGIIVPRSEYDDMLLRAETQLGYGVLLSGDRVLDCYNNRANCLASMANRATGVINSFTGIAPVPNCHLVVRGDEAYLRVNQNTNIQPGTEFCYAYGTTFNMRK